MTILERWPANGQVFTIVRGSTDSDTVEVRWQEGQAVVPTADLWPGLPLADFPSVDDARAFIQAGVAAAAAQPDIWLHLAVK